MRQLDTVRLPPRAPASACEADSERLPIAQCWRIWSLMAAGLWCGLGAIVLI